ncbi:hypothetical protein BOX15_Mlig030258g2 [Macrostomum lignano]|uniref:Ion transport domain-containing protein n=1 Tax=Macrostomum lignano TaxID=282301 RepID=A0A267H259_9PLAT|nr:hypothetical protein BOX15_Mlig030258g2 [Macrostomum lignano]
MAANSQDSSNLEDGIDWNRLEELLSGGQASGNSVHRLLHAAVRRNDAQALQLLLNHGADANAQADSDGQTPLHLCVEHSCSDCLKLLLTAGRADPNAVNQADETPLHSAAAATGSSSSTISTVRELLAGGADCNRVDCFGDNPLHRACQAENNPAVALLLKARPQLVNLPTGGDQKLTCLHIAASAENSELFTLLLCHGADFLAEDARGRSAIDLLLDKQDTTRIDCLGRHLFEEVRRFRHGESIYDLLDSPEGGRYLEQLLRIDGVCSPKQASTKSAEELAQAQSFSLAELRRLVAYRKLDAERLVSALEAAFEAGLADVLDSTPAHGELTQRLVEKTVQLVLLPQETELLGRLLSCRRLWRCLAWRMQAGVRQLYDTALRGSKAGIRQILRTECSRDDVATVGGKSAIDLNKLNAFLASTTTYWQFRRRELRLVEDSRAAMRDPLQSLALWATLTGRMRLVPSLLSQEEFDLVPLSLLIATLLRSLATRRDVEDVFADRADKVADQCEGMAIQVIKEVKEVDNSYGNNLTIAYVSLPLFNFANYTVLDLAARGGASSFIKLDIVELATDKSWYGDFYDFRQSFSREALILSGFLPPFMLLLPSLVQRMRNPESRRFLETITEASVTACEGEEEDKLETDNDEAEKATRLALLEDSEKDGRGAEQYGSQDASGGGRMTCREFVTELLEFYGTPCVKFRISVLFYFAFVGLLSVMILSDFQGPSSPIELICYFTILGIFIEEVREMISSLRQETLSVYLSDGWNVIDLIATLCGFLAFISRQISSKKFDFLALISDGTHERRSRDLSYVFIVITTLIVWIRILFISIVLESVGVKLKMLSLMIKKDFIPFLYILIVIMLGFGIAFHALLWPNGQYYAKGKAIDIDPPDILIQMFKRTFYTIVGEYGLDELETECQMHDPSASKASVAAATAASINATAGSLLSAAATEEKEIADEVVDDVDKCVSFPGSVLVPYVLMVVYIVVVQVLLLNVIVAMFSKTIDMVDSESKAMWLFERYDLNKEFIKRSALPPPFNIVLEARNLICWCLSKIMRLSRRRCSQAPEADQRQQQPLDIIKQHLNINDSEVKRQNFHNFVYLFYLFYQAVMLRRLRRKLDGFQADESELSSEGVLLLHRVGELRQVQSDLRDYLESQHSELSSVSQKLDRLLAMGGGDAGSG